jgi:hypothetical protein
MLTAPSWNIGVTHPRNGNERTASRSFVHQAYPFTSSRCLFKWTGRAAHGEQITPEISSPRVARPVSAGLCRRSNITTGRIDIVHNRPRGRFESPRLVGLLDPPIFARRHAVTRFEGPPELISTAKTATRGDGLEVEMAQRRIR